MVINASQFLHGVTSQLPDKLVMHVLSSVVENFIHLCYRCYLLLKGSYLCQMIQVSTVDMSIHWLVIFPFHTSYSTLCFLSLSAAALTS